MKFFAPANLYEPCGMFTLPHFIALLVCFVVIGSAVFITRRWTFPQVKGTIRIMAIFLTICEIGKIIFNFANSYTGLDQWFPLYFCSLFIYALWMAGFGSKKMAAASLSFLFGAGMVGGVAFLLMPTTSLMTYPLFHFLSFYSLFFHSAMCFICLLILMTHYYHPSWKSIRYYITFCGIFIILALIINVIGNANMMFLMQPYKVPVLPLLYQFSPLLYTFSMIVVHATVPFVVTFGIYSLLKKRSKRVS